MPPRTLSLEDKIQRETLLKQVFLVVDVDDSGILETSELLVLGEAMHKSPRECEMLLQTMDRNHDGGVSLHEFVSGFSKWMPHDSDAFLQRIDALKKAARAERLKREQRMAEQENFEGECCCCNFFVPQRGSCGQPKLRPAVCMAWHIIVTVLLLILSLRLTVSGSTDFVWPLPLVLLFGHVPLIMTSDYGADFPCNTRHVPSWVVYCFNWGLNLYCMIGPHLEKDFDSSAGFVFMLIGVGGAVVALMVEPFPSNQKSQEGIQAELAPNETPSLSTYGSV